MPTNPLSLISYPVLRRNQVMSINIEKFQQIITLKSNHVFFCWVHYLQSIGWNLKQSLKQRLCSKLKKNQEIRQQNSLPLSPLSVSFAFVLFSLLFLLCLCLSHYPYFLILFCLFVSSDKDVLGIPRLIWKFCFSCFSLFAFPDQQGNIVPKKGSPRLKYFKGT